MKKILINIGPQMLTFQVIDSKEFGHFMYQQENVAILKFFGTQILGKICIFLYVL